MYNTSGTTQQLRLDVITNSSQSNSGSISKSPLSADIDVQDYTNTIWVNKTGVDGTLLKLQTSGTDVLNLTAGGVMTLTGSFASSGNINSSGGAIQTNGVTRIDNSGNSTFAKTTTTNITIIGNESGGNTSITVTVKVPTTT